MLLFRPSTRKALTRTRYLHTAHAADQRIASLECERKFGITNTILSRTANCDGHLTWNEAPSGNVLRALRTGTRVFEDRYFDTDDALFRQGKWIRCRTMLEGARSTAAWEAKLRIDGDFTTSSFEEVTGKEEVSRIAMRFLGISDIESLHSVAHLITERSTWSVIEESVKGQTPQPSKASSPPQSRIKFMIDKCRSPLQQQESLAQLRISPFEHAIGEVEITQDLLLTGSSNDDAARRKNVTECIHREIEAFMQRYPGLFAAHVSPIGKLTAFYEWQRQACTS
ncbi:uncharacterized protein K489DRAFT_378092 [Dissoconium aciculare CBS 342.82]|uniref:CYTH domain-containing protein n=1 Tax=Dissoconium aciculare CBS 342.82 TaxID=1314786 RepID=A0A6J3MC01_9PEZI|nr:uncharacterized protein K489DRAFT_378092 [Dissoconium aciculare CBS 342.82]KAF1825551.1 hypothetical protein K489DRAFT_378092 [Dissoconium aciculare CBS 342.82]